MKKKDPERYPLSPKVLEAVQDMLDHSKPLVSLRAWWDVVRMVGQSEFAGEDDEYVKVFWNDMYFIGNILFAVNKDATDRLRRDARKVSPPITKIKKGGKKP